MSEHVTFYVGEDLEFHTGKFAEGLTLDQAIARYKTIKKAIIIIMEETNHERTSAGDPAGRGPRRGL